MYLTSQFYCKMARTVKEIYDAYLSEKQQMGALTMLEPNIDNSQALLSDLTTKSKVSEWRLWIWVCAVATRVLEELWDLFKKEVNEIVSKSAYGTPAWFQQKVFEWQWGDNVVFVNNFPGFNPIDETKQIAKFCSIVEVNDGTVLIKTAQGTIDNVVPLTSGQLINLNAYIRKIKPVGIRTQVVSQVGDKIKINGKVYFDAIVKVDDLKPLVIKSIKEFLQTMPFDGILIKNKLIDAVQSVNGVRDFELNELSVEVGTLGLVEIKRTYRAFAGYFVEHPNYLLDNNLDFIGE
jgi:hypothetical protein